MLSVKAMSLSVWWSQRGATLSMVVNGEGNIVLNLEKENESQIGLIYRIFLS